MPPPHSPFNCALLSFPPFARQSHLLPGKLKTPSPPPRRRRPLLPSCMNCGFLGGVGSSGQLMSGGKGGEEGRPPKVLPLALLRSVQSPPPLPAGKL